MTAVVYQFEFPYLRTESDRLFPGLVVGVRNPTDSDQAAEVQAEFDSGAEFSLFQGGIARAIGLDLLAGRPFTFHATNNTSISARIHRIIIEHPDLGQFLIDLRFSVDDIQRNILGRDFFDFLQIGFREHHSLVFITVEP